MNDKISAILLTLLIKDEFVATCSEEENALVVNFLNGQQFQVSVKEIK